MSTMSAQRHHYIEQMFATTAYLAGVCKRIIA
jgi:hypothetical protein